MNNEANREIFIVIDEFNHAVHAFTPAETDDVPFKLFQTRICGNVWRATDDAYANIGAVFVGLDTDSVVRFPVGHERDALACQ